MKNRVFLIAGAVGVVMIGGVRPAAAQPAAAPQTTSPILAIGCERMNRARVGPDAVWTIQGNVKLFRSGRGAVALTAGPDGLTFDDPGGKTGRNIYRVPMDLATMRVSVTPGTTVFQDQQGNRLTVESPPKAPEGSSAAGRQPT